jgi:hypothetical protein
MDQKWHMLDQEQIEARALVLEMKQAEIPTRLEEGVEDAYYRIKLYDAHLPTTQEAAECLAKLAKAV